MKPNRNSPFQTVPSLKPRRSIFDLSYSKTFDCEAGQIIPVFCDEVVPGDHFTINNEIVVRLNPLVAPVLSEVNVSSRYFFVPYRLLWDKWNDFISGGENGDFTGNPPILSDILTTTDIGSQYKFSLIDYFGFPVPTGSQPGWKPTPENSYSLFPFFAYDLVYNEYYRDQNVAPIRNASRTERDYSFFPAKCAWDKDYFTSALPFVQRGTVPAIPIDTSGLRLSLGLDGRNVPVGSDSLSPEGFLTQVLTGNETDYWLSKTSVIGGVSSVNAIDLRNIMQISLFQELNSRAGVRPTEFLKAHFGVSPRDDRLQRPEYIGGVRTPIMVSEVLQTSSTDTTSPQGNMSGHGITIDKNHVGRYFAQEFGLIIGLMTIMPRSQYNCQGVNRQWKRRSRFDYYFPEFSHLSEQAVMSDEIYLDNNPASVFGYQGRYNEMRSKQNMVCGNMRDTLSYWHFGRVFDGRPMLNESFIYGAPTKRPFAVQSEPGYIVSYGNRIKAVRPLPLLPNPGLMDHY